MITEEQKAKNFPKVQAEAAKYKAYLLEACKRHGISTSVEVQEICDGTIYIVMDQWLSAGISWGEFEQPSILKNTIETTVFEFSIAVPVYNYPSAPDDVDEVMQDYTCCRAMDAVNWVINTYRQWETSQILQGMEEQIAQEEWEKYLEDFDPPQK